MSGCNKWVSNCICQFMNRVRASCEDYKYLCFVIELMWVNLPVEINLSVSCDTAAAFNTSVPFPFVVCLLFDFITFSYIQHALCSLNFHLISSSKPFLNNAIATVQYCDTSFIVLWSYDGKIELCFVCTVVQCSVGYIPQNIISIESFVFR
jgi:hypothetical protein